MFAASTPPFLSADRHQLKARASNADEQPWDMTPTLRLHPPGYVLDAASATRVTFSRRAQTPPSVCASVPMVTEDESLWSQQLAMTHTRAHTCAAGTDAKLTQIARLSPFFSA